jgi:hypothetical protein
VQVDIDDQCRFVDQFLVLLSGMIEIAEVEVIAIND